MRPLSSAPARASLVAAALAATAFVPAAGAAGCTVVADTPQQAGAQVYGEGHAMCAGSAWITLTVCLEVQRPATAPAWQGLGCSTGSTYGPALSHGLWSCYQDGAGLVRTVALANTSLGYTAANSLPVLAAGVGSCGP